jgi:hypothetical protein
MREKADSTVDRAGIVGERGIAVHEGFGSSRANTFDETVGDVIPGASLLVSRARRIVLVTDKNVRVFQGRRFDRPGARLATYEIDPRVMSFNGERLVFSDGQVVYLTTSQARDLAHAAGVDVYAGTAEDMAEGLGIARNSGLTVACGTCPKPPKTSVRTRAFDVVLGGGELDLRETAEYRIVLVTGENIYVYEGRRLSQPGQLLDTYRVGVGVLSRDDASVAFPDGKVVAFPTAQDAQRVTAAADIAL